MSNAFPSYVNHRSEVHGCYMTADKDFTAINTDTFALVARYPSANKLVIKSTTTVYEPVHEKTNNLGSDQV